MVMVMKKLLRKTSGTVNGGQRIGLWGVQYHVLFDFHFYVINQEYFITPTIQNAVIILPYLVEDNGAMT